MVVFKLKGLHAAVVNYMCKDILNAQPCNFESQVIKPNLLLIFDGCCYRDFNI